MFYLIFLFCQYLRWVQYARNRVHWTRFVRLENEFNELGFYSCKPSSLNSVCFKGNTILVGYVSTIAGTTQKSTSGTQKNQTHKKTKFKLQTHSYTVSFPLTLSLSLSLSQSSSLSLLHSHSELVAPSLAPSPTVPVAVAASRFRRRRWRWMF